MCCIQGEVGGEVSTRYLMRHKDWVGWVHAGNLLLYVMSKLL